MILAGDVHFTTIEKVLRLVAGLLYVVTIEGNTTSYDALTTTPHNRDGVYRKRRIVRRSSVTIIRLPGLAKPVDPLAIAAMNRLTPKPKPKPEPKRKRTSGSGLLHGWLAKVSGNPWSPPNQDRKK
jgi:hypothetical protein